MSEEPKQKPQLATTGIGAGILASLMLAAVTGVVFYVLQDYGPESALRKYNQAILDGDPQAYDQVSVQPHNDRYSEWLARLVSNCLARNGRLRLIAMVDREPTYAVANAAYVLQDNTQAPVIFVITKQDHVWKVNPQQTRFFYQRALGMQSGSGTPPPN